MMIILIRNIHNLRKRYNILLCWYYYLMFLLMTYLDTFIIIYYILNAILTIIIVLLNIPLEIYIFFLINYIGEANFDMGNFDYFDPSSNQNNPGGPSNLPGGQPNSPGGPPSPFGGHTWIAPTPTYDQDENFEFYTPRFTDFNAPPGYDPESPRYNPYLNRDLTIPPKDEFDRTVVNLKFIAVNEADKDFLLIDENDRSGSTLRGLLWGRYQNLDATIQLPNIRLHRLETYHGIMVHNPVKPMDGYRSVILSELWKNHNNHSHHLISGQVSLHEQNTAFGILAHIRTNEFW